MATYRRWFVPGGTYFVTLVTADRRPILTTPVSRAILRSAIEEERRLRPFEIVAWVLLPEHFHAIWQMPPGDAAYPLRIARIKERFTRGHLAAGGAEATLSDGRRKQAERAVWQRRYWEHTCRDEDDVQAIADYIHWNPCKHGHVQRVRDYPWSTFHRFVQRGEYQPDWGSVDPCPKWSAPEWE